MRSSRFAFLAVGLLALVAGGCGDDGKTTKQGQLMLAIQTDMELPKDVDKVRIRVASYGNTVFSNDYQVGPSGLKIPATLALLPNPDRPSAPVTIQVIGFRGTRPRVMRESITTIPAERLATLRVPIEWLCDDSARMNNGDVESTCPSEETCISGTCMASAVDSDDLPDFKPEDVFGGGDGTGNGICFDTAQCFANAFDVPVSRTIDTADCIGTLPSDDANLNLALKPTAANEGICTGGNCIIPLDGGEGGQWSRASASSDQGTIIKLPNGVCDRIQGGKVAKVIASKGCATKTWRVPTCGPWSSSGGGGNTQVDGGGPSNMIDAGGRDSGSGGNDGPAIDDGGMSIDVPMADMGPRSDGTTGLDAGPMADAGNPDGPGGRDSGMGGSDVCMTDTCGQPPNCTPPPPPTDGGVCMGVTSMPAPRAASPCEWDVPGGIATTGMGFCPNLLNLHLVNPPGMPGLVPIPQVGEGQCGTNPGWQFIPSQLIIALCPQACMPVKDQGTPVQFTYGCPTMMPPPDGGPKDAAPPPPDAGTMPPDGPPPPPDGSQPPPDASVDMDGGPQAVPMLPIVGGMFDMGCLATDSFCGSDENPLHTVEVSDFSIDEIEVTQSAWDACIRDSACVAPPCSSWQPGTKGNWPVTCVNWSEASSYCAWAGKRLPTEAEWEIAARGNSGFVYPWGNQAPDCSRANFELCSFGGPQPVRSFPSGKSPYNAYDMSGNVGEWVFDWHGAYDIPQGPNPTGPATGSLRVVRGGDYTSAEDALRSSKRIPVDPNSRVDDIGFRCAKPGF